MVGYLVWLVPSGLGVREAVLVGLLAPASVIAVSLSHRLVTGVAEAILTLLARRS